MSIKRICKYGDLVLGKKTREVDFDEIKNRLPAILGDMWDTLGAVSGTGLAANQIGLSLRIAIIEIKKDGEKPGRFTLINPKVIAKSGSLCEDEGCLSLPGFFARIKRFAKVRITALNEKGMPIEIRGEGLLARAIQHEVDHLDGKIFIQRLPLITRLKIKRILKKLSKNWAKIDESV